mgnify:CR=1 FL=1
MKALLLYGPINEIEWVFHWANQSIYHKGSTKLALQWVMGFYYSSILLIVHSWSDVFISLDDISLITFVFSVRYREINCVSRSTRSSRALLRRRGTSQRLLSCRSTWRIMILRGTSVSQEPSSKQTWATCELHVCGGDQVVWSYLQADTYPVS